MASILPTPRYCIQHTTFIKQDGWQLRDVSLSLNGNIAVTGLNRNTRRTYIAVYTDVRYSESEDTPKLIYSKEFEEYTDNKWVYKYRYISFIEDDVLVSCLGDKLEVFQVREDDVIQSRKVNGDARCLSVRKRREIFIGFWKSNQISAYDLTDLAEIKSVFLQGINDGDYPGDMTVMDDQILLFTCNNITKRERMLIFNLTNGNILSQLASPSDQFCFMRSIFANAQLGICTGSWGTSYFPAAGSRGKLVFYSLLNESNCGFFTIEVGCGVYRVRISEKGDRIMWRVRGTEELKIYDMGDLLSYDRLKESLKQQILEDDCLQLIDFFNFPGDQRDAILKSGSHTDNLLLALERRGDIEPSNVKKLAEAFTALGIKSSCAYLVDFYQKTIKSSLVNGDVCDLTASSKKTKSKLGLIRDGNTMADMNSHSKRWADMISRITNTSDTLISFGSIKYSSQEMISTGSSGSHIFGGTFGNKIVAVKRIINENVQREQHLYTLMKPKAMCNVLKILHIERDQHFTYIVTKLCEYDLKTVIEDKKNPLGANLLPQTRIHLCEDILRGLRDLHAIDVIHRDLKPSNILVDMNGEAYVADFGISRNVIGETTNATGFYGTLCWIAREGLQSTHSKVKYKKESDVQVAGCLIYYILSNGHHPFETTFPFINDIAKLMNNVSEGTYSLAHIETYPAQCTALLKRMLEKDVYERPPIDDCLKEMEGVRCASKDMKTILTNDNSSAVTQPQTLYFPESKIPDEFSRLIVKISSNLTRRNCIFLSRYFNFSRAQIAEIKEESQTPGLDLLDTMIARNNINMYDLTNFQQALVDLQLLEINETLVIPYQSKIDPRTHEKHRILVPQSH